MGLLGRIAGGALQGLGAGVTEVARSQEEERRAMALEKLRQSNAIALEDHRSKNSMTEATHRGKITDTNNANQTARETNKAIVINKQEHDQRLVEQGQRQEFEAGQAATDRQHEERMVKIRGAIDKTTAEARYAMEAGQVVDSVIDNKGEMILIKRDGTQVPTGITANSTEWTFKPGGGLGGGGVLGEMRGAQGPASSAAPPSSNASGGSGTTYTEQEARDTAEKHGVSVEEVHRVMRERGYTLSN